LPTVKAVSAVAPAHAPAAGPCSPEVTPHTARSDG
jgi:hypothetical protein